VNFRPGSNPEQGSPLNAQADRVLSTPPETYEPFATPDAFCETLVCIERVGSADGWFLL
jgi:hypothetical protein